MTNLNLTSKSKIQASLFLSRRFWLALATIIILLIIPSVVHNAYIMRTIISIIIAVPLALGQNLITGYCGMLTLGQAAFYGLGAYTSALLVTRLGVPWIIALVLSGVAACLFGVVLSLPCLRVSSDYLTLVTIGFGQIFYIVALNWMDLTRGPMGLPAIPPPQIGPFVFKSQTSIYFLYLCITALGYLFMHRLTNSHIGRALIAIRENETGASAMGINVANYKILTFAFGSLWGGISGSMLAHFLQFVGPSSFTMNESLLHMQMAILGGLGSMPGSIIGAAILVSLPQLFKPIYQYQMLFNGVLMVLLLTWRPQGILGKSAVGTNVRDNYLKKLFGHGGKSKDTKSTLSNGASDD